MTNFSPEITESEYIGRARPDMDFDQHSGNTDIGHTEDGEVYLKRKRGVKEPNLAAGVALEHLPVRSPQVDYQDHTVIFENLDTYETLEDSSSENVDIEDYIEAAASKALIGDVDVSHNMMVGEGDVAPIDYDCAGQPISIASNSLLSNYESSHQEILDYEIQEEELKQKAGELAREVETSQLREEFSEFKILEDSENANQILDNIEKAQEWQ